MDPILRVVFLSAVGVVVLKLVARKKAQQLPPGPKPLPFLGNLFDIPASYSWLKFTEWQKIYGNIIHLSLLGEHVIVINSRDIARNLLDKRSRIYSSRPILHAIKMIGWTSNPGLLPYGEDWRRSRSTYNHVLRPSAIDTYHPIQLKYARSLLCNLLKSPDKYEDHIKLFSAQVILDATYSRQIKSCEDPFVQLGDEVAATVLDALTPGKNIFNTLPILEKFPSWFPGAEFKLEAAYHRRRAQQILYGPIDAIRQNMTGGVVRPSMASLLLERHEATGGSKEAEETIRYVTATTYSAGLESTQTTISSFIFVIMYHPEVLKKAQQEIISVIGPDRLPTFGDRKSLPYVEAIYRETMRCYPAVPAGIPHMTTEDDLYGNYVIPAGACVISNIWAMTHDEQVYPDPFAFKPERFFREDGTLNEDDEILAFGFGRRICPGRYFAGNTVWGAMASILCALNVSSTNGGEYPTDSHMHFTGAATSHPKPFKCAITARDAAMHRLLMEEPLTVQAEDV